MASSLQEVKHTCVHKHMPADQPNQSEQICDRRTGSSCPGYPRLEETLPHVTLSIRDTISNTQYILAFSF